MSPVGSPDTLPGPSGERPGRLGPEHVERVRAFLDTAPPELASWADEQLRALPTSTPIDEGEAALEGASGSLTSSDGRADALAVGDREDEESEDFYNGFENDDDIIGRRVAPSSSTARSASTPPAKKLSRATKVALVMAVLIGVGLGVWYAGHNRGDVKQADTSTPTMGTGVSPAESAVRIGELEEVVAQDPAAINARLELGVLRFNLQDIPAAMEQWNAVLEIDPDNVTALYNVGFAYLSQRPPDEAAAQAAWHRVVDIAPDSPEARTVSMHLEGLNSGPQDGVPSDSPGPQSGDGG